MVTRRNKPPVKPTTKHKITPAIPNVIQDAENRKYDIFEKGVENIKFKHERIREYRREASRLASKANKRIERLERNNLTDSPAYQRYIKDGGQRFGVRGKTYNEVQQEVARLNRFLNAETSTVRGTINVLKEMASNTGIKYENLEDLKSKASKFFELASKVEQYLRNVEDAASAIGYQKIWEIINTYVETEKIDLESGSASIDDMIQQVSNALLEYDTPAPTISTWYSVKKDEF